MLFDRTGCKTIVYASTIEKILHGLFDSVLGLQHKQAPSLQEFLNEDPVPHFAYTATYETLTNDPVMYLHTSGSSG